jgi:hypothetical protein
MSAAEHAIHALLWNCGYTAYDPSPDLRQLITADWNSFREKAEALGFDAVEHRAVAIDPMEGDEWDYAAHDFIFTRNHEGAGFWDGGWHAPWGDQLTDLARTFGSVCVYEEDGLIHSY